MAVIPGGIYTFNTVSFIVNAKIGLGLAWSVAYPVAAVVAIAYVALLLLWGKKRTAVKAGK